jgi:hypothetical protein
MSEKFNRMTFIDKIKTIRDNIDILQLAADHNWWGVKVRDTTIQQQLEDDDCMFRIENEWDSDEMHDLVSLIGIDVTDY